MSADGQIATVHNENLFRDISSIQFHISPSPASYFLVCILQILQKGKDGRGLWACEAGAGAVQPGARPGGAAQPGQQEARAGDQAQEHGPQLLQVSAHNTNIRS